MTYSPIASYCPHEIEASSTRSSCKYNYQTTSSIHGVDLGPLFARRTCGASFAFQDLLYTDIRAGNEAQDTEGDDGDVLPQPPVPFAETVLQFPDSHQFDHGWKHETQRG